MVNLQTALKAPSRQNQVTQICQTAKCNVSSYNCLVIFLVEICPVFHKSTLKTVSSPAEELNLCKIYIYIFSQSQILVTAVMTTFNANVKVINISQFERFRFLGSSLVSCQFLSSAEP